MEEIFEFIKNPSFGGENTRQKTSAFGTHYILWTFRGNSYILSKNESYIITMENSQSQKSKYIAVVETKEGALEVLDKIKNEKTTAATELTKFVAGIVGYDTV